MVAKFINLKKSFWSFSNFYWSVDHMKKTGLNGDVYYFSVGYSNTAVDDILDIHNHSQSFNQKEWHSIIKCLRL